MPVLYTIAIFLCTYLYAVGPCCKWLHICSGKRKNNSKCCFVYICSTIFWIRYKCNITTILVGLLKLSSVWKVSSFQVCEQQNFDKDEYHFWFNKWVILLSWDCQGANYIRIQFDIVFFFLSLRMLKDKSGIWAYDLNTNFLHTSNFQSILRPSSGDWQPRLGVSDLLTSDSKIGSNTLGNLYRAPSLLSDGLLTWM